MSQNITWPTSLRVLDFNNTEFNQPFENLSPSLTRLVLSDDFNHSLDNLPLRLQELQTGKSFNKPVENLPPSLLKLIFGDLFDQSVDNLPENLERLTLGLNFNNKIDHLPKLSYLKIASNHFNQSLDHLPSSLVYLNFKKCEKFDHTIQELPPSIQNLKLARYYQQNIILPSSIVKLQIPSGLQHLHLPSKLKKLAIYVGDSKVVHINFISWDVCL